MTQYYFTFVPYREGKLLAECLSRSDENVTIQLIDNTCHTNIWDDAFDALESFEQLDIFSAVPALLKSSYPQDEVFDLIASVADTSSITDKNREQVRSLVSAIRESARREEHMTTEYLNNLVVSML